MLNSATRLAEIIKTATELHQNGRIDEASTLYREILDETADDAKALHGLGLAAQQQGRSEEGLNLILKAIEKDPAPPYFHNNLAITFHTLRRYDEAIEACKAAIARRPVFPMAYLNLGNAYFEKFEFEMASAALKTSLEQDPTSWRTVMKLSELFLNSANAEEALKLQRCALDLTVGADRNYVFDSILNTEHYVNAVDEEMRFTTATAFGSQFPQAPNMVGGHTKADGKIRIGYVSGDLMSHAVAFLFAKILRLHDKDKFEVFCYSNTNVVDGTTLMLQKLTPNWRVIANLGDEDAIAKIRLDKIDILVDLSGHTANNRLSLFAKRAAPVQVSYLGYWATTGLKSIDYIIMDETAVPPAQRQFFSETLVMLPRTRFCYQPATLDDPAPPPMLKNGYVTFGSFNNIVKMNSEVFDLWSKVLKSVPHSKLLLKWKWFQSESFRAKIFGEFVERGIGVERLEFRGASQHDEMLKEYADIDIALDPFPFGGGVSSCEAMWMGVPIITLPGAHPAARQTLTFLKMVDLKDLAADSKEEYIEIAEDLADNPDRLRRIRSTMRAKMEASPLVNGKTFISGLEDAYMAMWDCQTNNLPKKRIWIENK